MLRLNGRAAQGSGLMAQGLGAWSVWPTCALDVFCPTYL